MVLVSFGNSDINVVFFGEREEIMKVHNSGNGSKKGCVFYVMAIIAICIAIAVYSYMWIPAIGLIIYFAIKKDVHGTRKRNIGISIAVLITSLIVFVWLNSPSSLTSIYADWGKTEFDISDTVEVKITPTPSDAEIESLELSENNIAELEYSNGRAVVTFTGTGDATLFFTANGKIASNSATITVSDKVAEEKAKEEAEKKAQEESKKKAQEEAAAAAQKAAEEEIRSQTEQTEQNTSVNNNVQDSQEEMVWIPQSGKKYHSNSSCSGMENPSQVTKSEAENRGYTPCQRCY